MGPVSFERVPIGPLDRPRALEIVGWLVEAGVKAHVSQSEGSIAHILVRTEDLPSAVRILDQHQKPETSSPDA